MAERADDVVFGNVQIGRGVRVLAQHGSMVIGSDGTLTLLTSSGGEIESAPIDEVSAKRIAITAGQSVSLRLSGHRYSVTPWWGFGRARRLVTLVNAAPRAT